MIDMIELCLVYMIDIWLIYMIDLYDWFMTDLSLIYDLFTMINMNDDEHDDLPSLKL